MEVFAHVKYVRMSPRKVKLVCDMIRGKDVKTAAAYLSQTSKAACEPMAKLLKSAVANAEHNNGMNADNQVADLVLAGIPTGIPVLDYANTQSMGINFLTHSYLLIKPSRSHRW